MTSNELIAQGEPMSQTPPSPTADYGRGERDNRGRFAPGNRAARGNPNARRVGRLRAELLRSADPADVRRVYRAMVEAAANGDTAAARVLWDRLFGPPVAADLLARLERVEELLNNLEARQ